MRTFQILIVSAVKVCTNNVCRLVQLLGDIVPQISYRDFVAGLHWGTSVPRSLGYSPQMKIPGAAATKGHGWSHLFCSYVWFTSWMMADLTPSLSIWTNLETSVLKIVG